MGVKRRTSIHDKKVLLSEKPFFTKKSLPSEQAFFTKDTVDNKNTLFKTPVFPTKKPHLSSNSTLFFKKSLSVKKKLAQLSHTTQSRIINTYRNTWNHVKLLAKMSMRPRRHSKFARCGRFGPKADRRPINKGCQGCLRCRNGQDCRTCHICQDGMNMYRHFRPATSDIDTDTDHEMTDDDCECCYEMNCGMNCGMTTDEESSETSSSSGDGDTIMSTDSDFDSDNDNDSIVVQLVPPPPPPTLILTTPSGNVIYEENFPEWRRPSRSQASLEEHQRMTSSKMLTPLEVHRVLAAPGRSPETRRELEKEKKETFVYKGGPWRGMLAGRRLWPRP